MTDGSKETSARTVWRLAGPAVALNSLQVVNTLLDRGFIGHLPADALTAHGGATSVMFLMFSLAIALSTGATALVSRAFGADDPDEYRRSSFEALKLATILGVVIAGTTLLLAGPASRGVLPADAREASSLMATFIAIYAIGLPAIFVIQVLAGSLRGIGDTKSPMVISGVQIGLHMALNVVLIPRMGLAGAATSLVISAWASAVGYLWFVRHTPLATRLTVHLPDLGWAVRILRIALPAALMAVLRVGSLTAFTLVLAATPGGKTAIGAMTTGFAIESVMFMPAFGLSTAAGALVGQSLGMRDPGRAERLAWTAAHHGALVTLALCGPIFLGAEPLAHLLLGGKPGMIAQAATLLRYLCVTEVFFAYAMILIGAMQGAGDTVRPMWISVFCLWGLRVPLAALLALAAGTPLIGPLTMPYGLGLAATGAWLAMALTQGLQGILAILAFRQGHWRTARV